MEKDLPLTSRDFVQIGDAAKRLGVSVDTIRRWNKSGKLAAVRFDGKNRYFYLPDLDKFRRERGYKVSQVAKKLGVSASTIRRHEQQAGLKLRRSETGERLYTESDLKLLVSRKRQPRLAPLRQPAPVPVAVAPASLPNWDWNQVALKLGGLVFAALFLAMISSTAVSVFLVQRSFAPSKVEEKTVAVKDNRVLAESDSRTGLFSRLGDWWGRISASLVASPAAQTTVIPVSNINQVLEIQEEQGKEGLVPKKALTITSADLLVIKETTLIENLNADFVRGSSPGVEIGDLVTWAENQRIEGLRVDASDLLSGSITGGTGGIILDGSIVAADIANGTITAAKLANGVGGTPNDDSVTAAKIVNGTIGAADLGDDSVTSSEIADNSVTAAELNGTLTFADGDFVDLGSIVHNDTGVQGLRLPNTGSSPSSPSSGEGYLAYNASSNQVIVYNGSSWSGIGGSTTLYTTVDDNTTTSSVSGLELSSSELSLIRGCSDGQVLKWNDGASDKKWQCSDDSGAGGSGISTVQEGDVTAVSSATTIDFLAADFTVSGGAGEADIAIDYTNSGITRKAQAETISGGWTFNTASTTFTTAIDVNSASTIAGLTVDGNGNFSVSNGTIDGALSLSGTTADNVLQITLTNGTSSGSQNAVYIDNAASTGITDALLVLDNSDTDTVVTSAIQFVVAGGTGFTNLFDINGTLLTASEVTVLDSGIALSELSDSGTFTATTVDINGGNIDGTAIGAISPSTGSFTSVTSTGAIAANSASGITSNQATLIINAGGTVDIQDALTADSVSVDAGNLTVSAGTIDGAISLSGTTTDNALQITLTNGTSSGSQNAVYIDNAASTGTTEALLVLDNSDTDTVVTSAIQFVIAGGTGFTNLLDINGTLLTASEVTILDGGIALSELTDSGTLTAGTVDINGGAIDGAIIGANSAAAGTFTTLTASTDAILPTGSIETAEIEDNVILEVDLKVVDTPGDEECLTYESTGGDFEWQDCGTGVGVVNVKEGGSTIVALATAVNFAAADFVITDELLGQAGIAIDYTNSKITRTNVSESIINDWTFTFAETEDLAINLSISGTNSGQGEVITLTNSSSSGNQYGLYLDNAASTGTTDSILVIDNSDTDTAVTNAIEFVIGGGTGFTNLFNVNGTLITSAEFTLLDSGIALSELTDSGDLIASGGVDFADAGADTITIGDSSDDVSITDANWSITGAGAGSFTSLTSTGAIAANSASGITSNQATLIINAGGTVDLQDALTADSLTLDTGDMTWSATTPTITINDSETFTITDAATPDSFTVNTSGSSFAFSDGTNSFTFDVDTGPVYAGTARPTRQETLSPEFAGAALSGDGSSNTGTMTSDFCSNTVGGVPNTNTGVCNTSGDVHNYYSWTTTQGTAQDYDIWIRWRVPDNFPSTGFSSVTDPIKVYGKRTDTTNNAVTVYVYDTAGTLENAGGTQVAGTAWTQTSIEATFAGTYTAGSYMTIRIVMNADTGDSVQVGEVTIDYKSSN